MQCANYICYCDYYVASVNQALFKWHSIKIGLTILSYFLLEFKDQ